MTLYRHYIGSTATHDAHEASAHAHVGRSIDAIGVWQGTRENTRITVSSWPGDTRATRHAATLARDTGNDVILVVRRSSPIDDVTYRVTKWRNPPANVGGFTIEPGMVPYVFIPDPVGGFTAWLVDAVGTITPINA